MINNDGLQPTFQALENLFGFNAKSLTSFARRDKFLGNDEGNPNGCSFGVEGRLLYAMIRALKPERVLEIGTWRGGSASHMALACKHNKRGQVWTMDISENTDLSIESGVENLVNFVLGNSDLVLPEWIKNGLEPFEFIFEDGPHSEGNVHNIYKWVPDLLKPDGWIISHDIAMEGVGQYILNGMRKGGAPVGKVKILITPPSPCGMSFLQYKPDEWLGEQK